jgi:hypothetical protein
MEIQGDSNSTNTGTSSTKLLFPVLLFVIALVASAYFFLKFNPDRSESVVGIPTPTSSDAEEKGELYVNQTYGYSLYLPKYFEIVEPVVLNDVTFVASSKEHDPAVVWFQTEPANGRTAEQAVNYAVESLEGDYGVTNRSIMVDGVRGFVAGPMPGQDLTRLVFLVQEDTLYRIMLSPDDPQIPEAYKQMEEAYEMIVKTFKFNN